MSLQRASHGQTPACTSCHGPTATSAFKDHPCTPEQTAGMSDDELEATYRQGTVPAGGFFDETVVTRAQFSTFHVWSMTDDQAAGIRVYLRALTPNAQSGADFGGKNTVGGG